MGDSYDENLERNPFFILLQSSKYATYFAEVVEKKYYILVPKIASLTGVNMNEDFVKRHLIHAQENGISRNLLGECVAIDDSGQKLIISNNNNDRNKMERMVRLLFEETYFTKDGASCKLFCLDNPLVYDWGEHEPNLANCYSHIESDMVIEPFRCSTTTESSSTTSPASSPSNSWTVVSDSGENLLFFDDCDGKLKKHLEKSLHQFYERISNEYSPAWHFEQLKMLVREEYFQVLKEILGQKSVSISSLDDMVIRRLKLAAEMYFYGNLHPQLMNLLCACVREEESVLNKLKHAASELTLSDWGINVKRYGNLAAARKELTKLNSVNDPYNKLLCLRQTIILLTNDYRKTNSSASLTSDDIIPVLAFLIAKSHICNWISNIVYMSEFHFSHFAPDELSYCLASFEAASQYIRDGSVQPLVLSKWRNQAMGFGGEIEHDELSDMLREINADQKFWERFVTAIDNSDEAVIKDCVSTVCEKVHIDQKPIDCSLEQFSIGACHPLCECEKCIDNRRKCLVSTRYSMQFCTQSGATAIHFACLFGRTSLLNSFIQWGGVGNVAQQDCNGRRPLHWSCMVGSQSCTLLLLHYGAQANVTDNWENTPLHTATLLGHVDCAKALLYYDQNVRGSELCVNAVNANGETPLHIAVRCHYVAITDVLLECGADKTLRDKNGKTAMDLCQDAETYRLLRSNFAGQLPSVRKSTLQSHDDQINGNRGSSKSRRPSEESWVDCTAVCFDLDVGKIDRLLKIISDDDLPMLEHSLRTETGYSKCHPLCQCEKCQDADETVNEPINLNATGSNGLNVLHAAILRGNLEVVRFLLARGVDVNWPSAADGRTPLHMAISDGQLSIISCLLENGADVYQKDALGKTALETATGSDAQPAVVEYFGKKVANDEF